MPKKLIKEDNKIKILFVYVSDASFIETDKKILEKNFNVTTLKYSGKKGFTKVLKAVRKSDLSFAWFEHDHAFAATFFSKIFRKKSIIVAADSFSFTEQWDDIKPSFKSKFMAKRSAKYASVVLADSDYKRKCIQNHIKGENVKLVYLGFDAKAFTPSGKKENMAITVGEVNDTNIWRKGQEMFVKAASNFLEMKFVVIGRLKQPAADKLKKIAPENVEFTGWITDKELLEYMQRAKVYVQLSANESFGCAVAEAMLCGCIPVVTNRGALPEVVGDVGFYAEYKDLDGSIEALKNAFKSDSQEKARNRIASKFPLYEREKQIVKIVHELFRPDK